MWISVSDNSVIKDLGVQPGYYNNFEPWHLSHAKSILYEQTGTYGTNRRPGLDNYNKWYYPWWSGSSRTWKSNRKHQWRWR